MGQANWQTVVTCVAANLGCQQVAAKLAPSVEKASPIHELAGFVMGAAFVYAIAKPLTERLFIPINTQAIFPITVFHALVHVVSKILFSPKAEEPKKFKEPVKVKVEPQVETPVKLNLNRLHGLVSYFDSKWDAEKKDFVGIKYDPKRIHKNLFECILAKFDRKMDYGTHHGFIEKKEVPKGSKVFVRADLHGDLKSLLENLKAMQREGLLDKNFKCKPGTHMVFCGDYMDRGGYSIEIAEVLALLQAENPDQVFLIRGNHEYLETNYIFCGRRDENFANFINDYQAVLQLFYRTMPLTVFLAEEGGEYVDFTHGLFELHIDPSEMLDSETTNRLYIPKASQEFSERVQKLAELATPIQYNRFQHQLGFQDHTPSKTHLAAKRIVELKATEFDRTTEDTTAYNWGDVRSNDPKLGSLGARAWHMRPQEVKDALRLMGNVRKVKLVFRGHQHRFQHGSYKDKVIVTTLPVGADTGFYERYFGGQPDRAYILDVDQKVKNWKKHAFIRKSGETKVEITSAHAIFSAAV